MRLKTTKYVAILWQVEKFFLLLCVLSFVISFLFIKVFFFGLPLLHLFILKSLPFICWCSLVLLKYELLT
jgi:hypothetical protein